MKLLLVEDDPNDIMFMKRALGKVCPGIELEIAKDGDQAVERLSRGDVTHVFLDLKLPKRSGLEILEWVRGRQELKNLRVVILTSSQEKPDLGRARELGVDSYRVKPVRYPDLLAILRATLSEWGIGTRNGEHGAP